MLFEKFIEEIDEKKRKKYFSCTWIEVNTEWWNDVKTHYKIIHEQNRSQRIKKQKKKNKIIENK